MGKTIKADITIIGGGGSGLAAAVGALEKGAKSILILEKYAKLGGNAVNPGGIFGADTALERRLGQDVHADDAFRKMMDYAHWKLNGALVRALINRSTDTISWLESKGLKFVDLVAHFRNQVPNAYHVVEGPDRTGTAVVKVLSRECEQSKAVRILLKTEAQKLVTDNHGRVTGVIARDENGNPVKITSKSVIVCTGGFSGNEALINKYDPTYSKKEVPPAGIPQNGDGIRMASEIGAALDGMLVFEWGGFFADSPVLTVIARRCQNVWINKKGRRYYDESMPISAEMANALYRQPGRVMYCLFDELVMQQFKNDGVTVYEGMFLGANKESADNFEQKIERDLKAGIAKGNIKKARSWKEIARWVGIEPAVFETTIAEYNSFCDRGHDDIFAKDRHFLQAIRKPPFYALKCGLRVTTMHGGIKINEKMEALDKNDDPIPGLYAAGIETGGTEWDSYNMGVSGHAFGFAINSGRIAGEEATKYVASP